MRHPHAPAERTTDPRIAIGAKDVAPLSIAILALVVSAITLWAQFFWEESNLNLSVPRVYIHFDGDSKPGSITGTEASIIGEYQIAFLDTGNRPVFVRYVGQGISEMTSKAFSLLNDADKQRADELSKPNLSLDEAKRIVQKYDNQKFNNLPPCETTKIRVSQTSSTDTFRPIIVSAGKFNLISAIMNNGTSTYDKVKQNGPLALLACLHIEYVFADGTEGVDDIPIQPITIAWQQDIGLVLSDSYPPIIPPLHRIGRQVSWFGR